MAAAEAAHNKLNKAANYADSIPRTPEALDLSKHRLAVRKQTERKNGLSDTERRVLLPTDAEIPGESANPDTNSTQSTTGNQTPPATPDVSG